MKRAMFFLLLVCAGTGLMAQQNRKASAPVAERAAIMLLEKETAQGNAVLYVQFPAAEAAARLLKLDGERESTTLRDDGVAPDQKEGDGTHSAYIRVDRKQLEAQRSGMLKAGSVPVFAGRELIGIATATLSTTPVTMKDIPATPDAARLRRTANGKQNVVQVLKLGPLVTGGAFFPLLRGFGYWSIDSDRSLLITDPSVVQDPSRTNEPPCDPSAAPALRTGRMGKWSFGHLMEEMAKASNLSREAFVRQWLAKWETDQTVNGLTVANRQPQMAALIAAWPLLTTGELDLSRSPFKLVAIVNRIDLGGSLAYGAGNAGEARFIFAADCTPGPGILPPPFMVIFEYTVPVSGCRNVKNWAKQWKDLDQYTIGSTAYNSALAAITVQFTEAKAGTKPAWVSYISQIRTNEAALKLPWELREFRPGPVLGWLQQVTVKQTPDDPFEFTDSLAAYAMANQTDIVHDDYTVPDTLGSVSFLGGASTIEALLGGGAAATSPGGTFWDGPPTVTFTPRNPAIAIPSTSITTPELRHHLSFNTCNACHGGETATKFTHVDEQGTKSGFLTGIDVPDPAGATFTIALDNTPPVTTRVTRSFDDLLRRRIRMADIINQSCAYDVLLRPFKTVH